MVFRESKDADKSLFRKLFENTIFYKSKYEDRKDLKSCSKEFYRICLFARLFWVKRSEL